MYRMQQIEVGVEVGVEIEVEVEAVHRVTLLMFSGGWLVIREKYAAKNSWLALLPASCFCYSPILLFTYSAAHLFCCPSGDTAVYLSCFMPRLIR